MNIQSFCPFLFSRTIASDSELFPQLWALDRDLAKNLTYCKTNDVTDLCLTFSTIDTSFGQNAVVDLLPDGTALYFETFQLATILNRMLVYRRRGPV